jgi:molybdopterin converting factor small subunit
MSVTLNYFGQLRQFAGAESEAVELSGDGALVSVLKGRAEQHGEKFGGILFADDGALRPSVMVLVNDAAVNKAAPPALNDGDQVKLLAAIAGG